MREISETIYLSYEQIKLPSKILGFLNGQIKAKYILDFFLKKQFQERLKLLVLKSAIE